MDNVVSSDNQKLVEGDVLDSFVILQFNTSLYYDFSLPDRSALLLGGDF
jgi:hypothetical protein